LWSNAAGPDALDTLFGRSPGILDGVEESHDDVVVLVGGEDW
jgi:hypothetical protein